jgi:hypothetical protein
MSCHTRTTHDQHGPDRSHMPVLPGYPSSGEITGLQSAKDYAASMAGAYAAAESSLEEFTAGLEAAGVTGEAITAAAQAVDAQANAAAAWQLAHAALSKQDVVANAYAAVPGAGSREFVTGE